MVSRYKVESGDLGPVDVTVLLLLLLPLLLHRHCSDHLLLQRNQSPFQLMSLNVTDVQTAQLRNICSHLTYVTARHLKRLLGTFLFSFCFFFFSLTISRSSMVSSKESPDFFASAGNGSLTRTCNQFEFIIEINFHLIAIKWLLDQHLQPI